MIGHPDRHPTTVERYAATSGHTAAEDSDPLRGVQGDRLPLDPLAARLGIALGQVGGQIPHIRAKNGVAVGLGAVAEELGISHTSAKRLRRHGLTYNQADRFAIRVGYLPTEVWGAAWYAIGDEADG